MIVRVGGGGLVLNYKYEQGHILSLTEPFPYHAFDKLLLRFYEEKKWFLEHFKS